MATIIAPDGGARCAWAVSAPEYIDYHDREWGFPVDDDVRLFEKVSLEGFQAGLSWITILRKRENFRAGFRGFDFDAVARFTEEDVQRLLSDSGIIRHRGKIEAVINNAARAIELRAEFGSLAAYFWQYESPPGEVSSPQTLATTPTSVALSKDLKRRGWKFVGPTTMFALMQAMGLINDHHQDCVIRTRVGSARAAFSAPRPPGS